MEWYIVRVFVTGADFDSDSVEASEFYGPFRKDKAERLAEAVTAKDTDSLIGAEAIPLSSPGIRAIMRQVRQRIDDTV